MVRHFVNLVIFVWFSVQTSRCRDLWSADLPEIRSLALEKEKPLQLQTPYTRIQLCDLSGTIYSDSLSQLGDIKELRICRSNIEKIEPGALCSSKLETLELDFYGISKPPVLNKEVFENCNIKELILRFNDHNNTYEIDNDSLTHLSKLKRLYLQGYNLQDLRKNFLRLPLDLSILAISFGNILEIDCDVFEDLNDLEEIFIINNRQLKSIPKDLFKNNSKLRKLVLRGNAIENVTWDEFEGLTYIETLTLTHNKISNFDAAKIAANLPKLKSLSIDLNPPTCKQKEAFVNELKNKLRNVEVTYKFDPGYYDSCEEE